LAPAEHTPCNPAASPADGTGQHSLIALFVDRLDLAVAAACRTPPPWEVPLRVERQRIVVLLSIVHVAVGIHIKVSCRLMVAKK
jgi:hypothetical protein